MPLPILVEPRAGFRSGLNVKVSPNRLNVDELVVAENVRLEQEFEAVSLRNGSQRMHETSLGASITGLAQWDAPGGKQLVALADGDLWHKTSDLGEFTQEASTISNVLPSSFMTARQNVSEAPLRLYFADGAVFWKWTGSELSSVMSTGTEIPSKPDLVRWYHTRAFWRSRDFMQTVYWSRIGDPEDGTIDVLESDGGASLVDVLRGEPIVAIEVVGSSLLIATSDSVVRFTGYSSADIRIESDTEGISADVGCVGPLALLRAEEVALMAAERDVYLVNEQQALPIGAKIRPLYLRLDRTALNEITLGYHKTRREVWLALQDTVFVFSIELNAWVGPFSYPFDITCFAQWEDANGDEFLIAGCSDGFVRNMDVGTLDDVRSDGTSGDSYTGLVEFAPVWFESGPHQVKSMRWVNLQAEIPEDVSLSFGLAADDGSFVERTATGSDDEGIRDYRLDFGDVQGKRFRPRVRMTEAGQVVIHGFTLEAWGLPRN